MASSGGRETLDSARRWRVSGGLPALALWLLLGAVVVGVVLPAVLFDAGSRVFLVKVASVVLFAGLPAWLYLHFIANRGFSLYDAYVLNLFRLHIDEPANLPAPPQHTSYYRPWKAAHDRLGTAATDNLYRRRFEAVYGAASVSTRALFTGRTRLRDRAEAFSPVLVATVVFALGWSLLLEPEVYRSIRLLDGEVSQRPALPVVPLQYGFLGAYAFVVQDLVRRYFRDDLRAGAYVGATVRVVFVVIVVAALGLVWPADLAGGQAAFAFLVGMFPQLGLQALRAAIARPLRGLVPRVASDQPLSQLDGLNIWVEARFVEEGVEDLQNLVSADLVDLLLNTRVPVTRLVDWIDQACLLLHVPAHADAQRPGLRPVLRRLGVRTATDLQRLWRDETHRSALIGELAVALDVDEAHARCTAAALCASLEGDVNLWHVARFKQRSWLVAADEPPQRARATRDKPWTADDVAASGQVTASR